MEASRKGLGNVGDYTALHINLPNLFDCLLHDSVIAKLHACGFYMHLLKLTHSSMTLTLGFTRDSALTVVFHKISAPGN